MYPVLSHGRIWILLSGAQQAFMILALSLLCRLFLVLSIVLVIWYGMYSKVSVQHDMGNVPENPCPPWGRVLRLC